MTLDKSSPEYLEALTAAILGLSRYFVGVPYDLPPPGGVINGRDKLDPVYREVTENRDGPGPAQRKTYSSCADQPHAILKRLGVEASWVNQGANHVYGAAQMTKLQPGACPAAQWALPDGSVPPPGSLCLIWTSGNDAHALVLHGPGSDANHVLTANYGAGGMSEATSPGSNLADSPLRLDAQGFLHIGESHRQLHSYITPARLIPYLTGPMDLTGAIVTDDVIEALGARWDHA